MIASKSVSEIFLTMDCTHIPPLNRKGKEWLNSYRQSGIYGGHVSSEKDDPADADIEPALWKKILNKIVTTLKDESDLLTEILNELLYNSRDAKELVTNFYDDFSYYIQTADDCAFYANAQGTVDLDINIRDIYILGRLLSPLLISGCNIRIHPHDEYLVPYLVAIGNILTNNGTLKYIYRIKYVFISSIIEDPRRLTINGVSTPHYCPVLIFEESDLDSALDSLLESAFRYNGMLYWSITHAYIQETIFDDVVCKLQDLSKRIQHIEFINCDQRDQLKETNNNFPRFFIGWDPRELEIDCDLTLTVCLLPFRTIDEVVSLVTAQGNGCAASIWSDKLSIANRLIKLLKFGTIWINSHGLLDPSIPFESCTETRLPFNGIQLLEYLTRAKVLSPEIDLDTFEEYLTRPRILSSEKLLRNSIEEAVDVANQGYEILNKSGVKDIQNLLNLLPIENAKQINMASKVTSLPDIIYHPSAKEDVLCFMASYQVIMITFSSKAIEIEFFLQLLYCLIATRNAVIVRAPSTVLIQISDSLPTTLPQGIVTLIELDVNIGYSLQTKKIGKFLHFGTCFTKSTLHFGEHSNYLCSLFSCKKSVWLQTE